MNILDAFFDLRVRLKIHLHIESQRRATHEAWHDSYFGFRKYGNTVIAREICNLGVYSEIHSHDITVEELQALDYAKGIILYGSKNSVVGEAEDEIRSELYDPGVSHNFR